jgi:hypothetical protein
LLPQVPPKVLPSLLLTTAANDASDYTAAIAAIVGAAKAHLEEVPTMLFFPDWDHCQVARCVIKNWATQRPSWGLSEGPAERGVGPAYR